MKLLYKTIRHFFRVNFCNFHFTLAATCKVLHSIAYWIKCKLCKLPAGILIALNTVFHILFYNETIQLLASYGEC